MKASEKFLKALASAQDRKNGHKMPTIGQYISDSGPALQARCEHCHRYAFQFSDHQIAGTATERECGDRVPA